MRSFLLGIQRQGGVLGFRLLDLVVHGYVSFLLVESQVGNGPQADHRSAWPVRWCIWIRYGDKLALTLVEDKLVSGNLNVLVDDPHRARKALDKEGLTVSLKEVIAVVIEDKPGGLDELVQMLAGEDINVENAYGFAPLYRS